jgi:hypothetical protein
MSVAVFRAVTLCGLVGEYQNFECFPLKLWYPSTSPHGVTIQMTTSHKQKFTSTGSRCAPKWTWRTSWLSIMRWGTSSITSSIRISHMLCGQEQIQVFEVGNMQTSAVDVQRSARSDCACPDYNLLWYGSTFHIRWRKHMQWLYASTTQCNVQYWT